VGPHTDSHTHTHTHTHTHRHTLVFLLCSFVGPEFISCICGATHTHTHIERESFGETSPSKKNSHGLLRKCQPGCVDRIRYLFDAAHTAGQKKMTDGLDWASGGVLVTGLAADDSPFRKKAEQRSLRGRKNSGSHQTRVAGLRHKKPSADLLSMKILEADQRRIGPKVEEGWRCSFSAVIFLFCGRVMQSREQDHPP